MDRSLTEELKSATKSDWDAVEERNRIADGCYDGFIINNVKTLIPKLPLPHPEFTDAYQEFVGYALEAVELFNPQRGVQFATFLYGHLHIRSLQWFNCAWMAKTHPRGRFVTTFSQYGDTDGSEDSESGSTRFDPTRVRDTQQLTSMVNELRESLSPRAMQLFDYFVDLVTWDENQGCTDVLACFASRYSSARVSKLTGLERSEVSLVLEEITSKARKFVPV